LLGALSSPWVVARLEPAITSLALGPANPTTRAILAARRAARRASDHQASLRALAALVRAQRQAGAELASQVGAITAPALVVRGALDPLVSAADARRAVASLGQGKTLEVILPNAGHLPWLQQPGPLLNAVAGLLETVEQG
jgi:pimeloyl-ACP methyl ester carboxylesterase